MHDYQVNKPPPNPPTTPPVVGATPPVVTPPKRITSERFDELRQACAVLLGKPSSSEGASQQDFLALVRIVNELLASHAADRP